MQDNRHTAKPHSSEEAEKATCPKCEHVHVSRFQNELLYRNQAERMCEQMKDGPG